MPRVGVVGVPGGWSTESLAAAFGRRTGYARVINPSGIVLDVSGGLARCGDTALEELDALAIKKIGTTYHPRMLDRLSLLDHLHGRGLAMFSRPARIKHVLDRLSCTLALRSAGVPIPPTVVTEDPGEATAAVEAFGAAILKPLYTSKARGMLVVRAGERVRESVVEHQAAGHSMLYVQKLLPLPGWDLGLAFLGGDFICCYARVAHDSAWNTTTNSGGKYRPYDPSEELIEVARRAQAPFELDFTCVDLAVLDDGPVVFEVSAFGGFRGLWEACGVDAAGLLADYILKRLSNGP